MGVPMSRIEIHLESDETPEEAEEQLYKSLHAQRTGELHKEDFHQPAARAVVSKLSRQHAKMLKSMMKDIEEVLDRETY